MDWLESHTSHNVLYDETFTTFVKKDKWAPGYAKIMAPYLDWLFSNRPWSVDRAEFLKFRLKEENSFNVYPYWCHEFEQKTIRYLLEKRADRQKLAELYRLFKELV